jgi:hypothetical protein
LPRRPVEALPEGHRRAGRASQPCSCVDHHPLQLGNPTEPDLPCRAQHTVARRSRRRHSCCQPKHHNAADGNHISAHAHHHGRRPLP